MSGDSTGAVVVWSKRTSNPVKVIKEMQADVMTVVCGKDMIYASGVDSKVISIRLVSD